MSRVIRTGSASTERNRLKKALVLAIRELMKQSEPNETSRDLIAFILLCLERITETVEESAEAWEKRGYWLKADHFRMEWEWARLLAERIRPNVLTENYNKIIPDLIELSQSLNDVTISDNHRLGTPWLGAWDQLHKK
ncbi:MAG TPA: hypothetical protein PKV59_05635 [Flexilinea sp.]|jgi:hypothetical protein|nr:MAG: hypothetical protein BWY58_00617 [Chloroflexi bacterium ADurb.Bin344]HNY94479.1 hypothetical protein [Flexilinea sp.]HOG21181.1 hypothetical protein [Flexilinea sp.]HOG60480.1 hypothetical protein [Flexilinea sp.]HOP01570.1 hypothetical protein [Flexilinea sp.]